MLTLVFLIIIGLGLYVIMLYNGFVKLDNRAHEAWADIDVQLKRRYNLIPNLVETVKGYAAHEAAVFTQVTEARAAAMNAGSIEEHGKAENMLSGALKSLFAVTENYPELKANQNFAELQRELVDTEDKIQAARRFYNGVVRDFNTKTQQFPSKLIADAFQYKPKDFFELTDEEQRENVQVSFTDQPAAAAPMTAPAEPVAEAPEQPVMPEEPAPMPEATPEPEVPEAVETPQPEMTPAAEMPEAPVEPTAEPAEETPTPEATEAPAMEVTPEAGTPAEPAVEAPVSEEPKQPENTEEMSAEPMSEATPTESSSDAPLDNLGAGSVAATEGEAPQAAESTGAEEVEKKEEGGADKSV